MHSNRIQDILLSRPLGVNSVERQRHKRKLIAGQLRMQGWLTSPHVKSPLVPESDKSFVVVRSGKKRHADLYRLTKRFKDIDY